MKLVCDQPFLDQVPDRLAHRAAAGAEHSGDVHLAELLALGDASIDDCLPQLREDLLGGGGTFDAAKPPLVRGRGDRSRPPS
jgi:hypothetical protein